MIWFKSCPRCLGDLAEEWQLDGNELVCIQCGYRRGVETGGVSVGPTSARLAAQARGRSATRIRSPRVHSCVVGATAA